MKIRELTSDDIVALKVAIRRDEFHPGEWGVQHFFSQPKCPVASSVIEDDQGPVAFVRFTKTLRISCVWNDGADHSRNARAIMFGIRQAIERARASGFSEIVIQTKHPKLAEFLTRVIGMNESGGEYVIAV